MTGRVAEAAGPAGGTMLETPIGTLALGRRLAVPSGTLLAFEALATPVPPPGRDEPQIQRRDWPALAEALAALDLSAPELAARLRSALAPESGSQLAANLLFLIGALRSGIWPGAAVDQTLSAAGHDRLCLRLADDTAEWRRPDAEQGSCDWRVFVLPVLDREAVRPVEIYVRRRDAGATAGEDARFLVEAEIGRFGPLQLDGLLRKPRFDVVLRSQRTLDAALCQAVSSIFRDAAAAEGLAGDISFQTVPRFAVAPREALRSPVAVEV
jgi:hypothetical protein